MTAGDWFGKMKTNNMGKEEIKKQIQAGLSSTPLGQNVKRLSLFGSRLNGGYREDSDVDLLVDFNPTAKIGFFEFVKIQKILENFLKKNVDLVTPLL